MKTITAVLNIAKTIMTATGGALIALQPVYGSQHWYTAALVAYGALGVYFADNTKAKTPQLVTVPAAPSSTP